MAAVGTVLEFFGVMRRLEADLEALRTTLLVDRRDVLDRSIVKLLTS